MAEQENPTRPDVRDPYVPVYVIPLASPHHPTPPGSRTAMYAATFPPPCPLRIGLRVHIHLAYSPTLHPSHTPNDPRRLTVMPLDVKGRIAGERGRTDEEVDFVVMNEVEEAPIRRAFIRARFLPNFVAAPSIADLVASRLRDRKRKAGPTETEGRSEAGERTPNSRTVASLSRTPNTAEDTMPARTPRAREYARAPTPPWRTQPMRGPTTTRLRQDSGTRAGSREGEK